MDPILVDIALLRAMALPDVKLTPGRVIVARVVAAGADGRGELSIAGARLSAALPPGVHEGEELRLLVKDVSADRVVLAIQSEAPSESASPQPASEPRNDDIDPEGGVGSVYGTPTHVLAMRYDAPTLGAVDLRFELYAGALRVAIVMGGQRALASGLEGSQELHDALARATSLDVSVSVAARRPPLDLYV
jgi:hypothetical protein